MTFYSETNKPKTIPMPKCSEYQEVYQEVLDKEGKTKLKVIEKVNVYEKIQESKDSVILANLLETYKLKVNENNLTKLDETVLDLTNLPENLSETLNLIDNAKLVFDQTPGEIKSFFNNNFSEFLQGAQNGTLTSLLNEKYNRKNQTVPQEQVAQPQVQVVAPTTNTTPEEVKGVDLNV